MEINNKKGQVRLEDTPTIIISLLIIGIFLAIGSIILSEIQVNQISTTATTTVLNETHTGLANNTVFDLTEFSSTDVGFAATITTVHNNSGSVIILAASNFTFDGAGSFTPFQISGASEFGDVWNVSYTFTETDQNAFLNITTDSLAGLDTMSSFQTVIAVVVAAAIILGVVFIIRT